jgi:hypothetical protein
MHIEQIQKVAKNLLTQTGEQLTITLKRRELAKDNQALGSSPIQPARLPAKMWLT